MKHFPLWALWVLPLVYAAVLAWQEWAFRNYQPLALTVAAPLAQSPAAAPLNTSAVATVFGLVADSRLAPSAESMTLHASFVLETGLSKALLADARGARLYHVGDRLPGGSVLRRVDAQQVVLWNKGREESLPLAPSDAAFFKPSQTSSEAASAAVSARHLRPIAGDSE